MAGRFGGKWVFGIGMLAVALAALLIPVAARTNYILVMVLRIIQGLGEVVTSSNQLHPGHGTRDLTGTISPGPITVKPRNNGFEGTKRSCSLLPKSVIANVESIQNQRTDKICYQKIFYYSG